MERFHLKKRNGAKDKEQYRVEVSNRFAALVGLDDAMRWTLLVLGKLLH
jgi:hypothetical protein